jgi:hypothetical protein
MKVYQNSLSTFTQLRVLIFEALALPEDLHVLSLEAVKKW